LPVFFRLVGTAGSHETGHVTAPIDAIDWLTRLDATMSDFATLLAMADTDRPVPGCPGWTLADLADHLGNVHAWAAHAVAARNPDLPEVPAPRTPAELTAWYSDRAGSLLATLTATEPDAPAWAFGLEDGRAEFWWRRQTHETTIHLWDARASQGAAEAIDVGLAMDGIDEIATVLFPRQVRLRRMRPVRMPVALLPTDADVAPFVLAGDGTVTAAPADAAATVRAPAELLLLLLWKRLDTADPRLTVTGDPAAYRDLMTRALTP
jgi:uncharacterized protein (TIGR03083 family)